MGKSLFVGIDVGSDSNTGGIMDSDENKLAVFDFANNLPGAESCVDRILREAARCNADHVHIGLDSTNVYWWHLHQVLVSHPRLNALNVTISVLNPKVVDGYKKSFVDRPKTDKLDSLLIADLLRVRKIAPTPPPDMRYEPLKRLTRFRFQLIDNIVITKNRMLNVLFLKFSNYQADCPFSDIYGKTSLEVIEHFTPDEIANMSLAEFTKAVFNKNHAYFKDIPKLVTELQNAAKKAYKLDPKMHDSVNTTLSMHLDALRFFDVQKVKLDKLIERELKAIPQTLDTVPGIGPVYTAGIIAETGNIQRFSSHDALAKFMGLTWRNNESSHFQASDLPLTRSGNFYLRYYMVEAANSVRVCEPEYAQFYRRKFQEARHHHHKRALVLTARKLVRLVFTLLSEGQIYQARKVT